MDKLSFSEKIFKARSILGMTQQEFAEKLGISHRTILRYEHGLREPKLTFMKAVDDILMGKIEAGETKTAHLVTNNKEVKIPLVAPRLSAGSGELVYEEGTEKFYTFTREFVSQLGQVKNLVLMRVRGESMRPTISNNDMVMVDVSKTQPEEDMIFAVGWFDEIMIKRLRRKEDGAIEVVSDNPAFPIKTVQHEHDGFRIIGKVVWLARVMG